MTAIDLAAPAAIPTPAHPDTAVPHPRQPSDPLIGPPDQIPAVLAELRNRLDAARPTNVGFPSTLDLDITPLLPFFNVLLNNVGDPDQPAVLPATPKTSSGRSSTSSPASSALRPMTGGATSRPAAVKGSSTGSCSPGPSTPTPRCITRPPPTGRCRRSPRNCACRPCRCGRCRTGGWTAATSERSCVSTATGPSSSRTSARP
jgi:hypothetical protein